LKRFSILDIGALINSKNLISDERKSKIAVFYSLRQIRRSTATCKAVKIEIYKMMVKPILVYGNGKH